MMRLIQSVAFAAILALLIAAPSVAVAGPSHDAASTASVASPHPDGGASPAVDPYLGGDLSSRVPLATDCRDYGQCVQVANGTPCDTPIGCVCGWAHGQRACGRW